MRRRKRRDQTPVFKAKITLEAHVGEHTQAKIAKRRDVHPAQV